MTKVALNPAEVIYQEYEPDVADELRRLDDLIRARGQDHVNAIIAIGRLLDEVKGQVGHGNWGPWLSAEFSMSTSTAERYMRAARFAVEKNVTVTNLSPSTLYLLSSKSTPPSLAQDLLDRVMNSQPISESELKREINRAKQSSHLTPRKPGELPRPRPDESLVDDEDDPATAAVQFLRKRLSDDFLHFIELWRRAGAAFESALSKAASMASSEGSQSHGA